MRDCWVVVEVDVKALFCQSCYRQNGLLNVTHVERYDDQVPVDVVHVDPSVPMKLDVVIRHCSELRTFSALKSM